MTQHSTEPVADTAERDAMDQVFDAIRAALSAAWSSGLAEGRYIYEQIRPTPELNLAQEQDLADRMREAVTAYQVAQVAMWQAMYAALSELEPRA